MTASQSSLGGSDSDNDDPIASWSNTRNADRSTLILLGTDTDVLCFVDIVEGVAVEVDDEVFVTDDVVVIVVVDVDVLVDFRGLMFVVDLPCCFCCCCCCWVLTADDEDGEGDEDSDRCFESKIDDKPPAEEAEAEVDDETTTVDTEFEVDEDLTEVEDVVCCCCC